MELIDLFEGKSDQFLISEKIEIEQLKKGIIYFVGDFDDDLAKDFLLKLEHVKSLKLPKVRILIHSYGGSIDSLNLIMNEVNRLKKAGIIVETEVLGVAYSAGAALLVSGSPGHRFAGKDSTIMFHPGSYGLSSDYSAVQESATKFFSLVNERLTESIVSNIKFENKKDKTTFLKKTEKGLWLFAEDALKLGVIDEII